MSNVQDLLKLYDGDNPLEVTAVHQEAMKLQKIY